MIVYFADRYYNILCVASTGLPEGIVITEDLRTQDIETGISTLSFKIPFDRSTRKQVVSATAVGNFVLRSDGEDNECYTIIDTEFNTGTEEIYVYAEDAGLDLLNKVALIWPTSSTSSSETVAHSMGWYVNKFLTDSDYSGGSAGGGDTGFELGKNEAGTAVKKQLTWDSEETLTARLLSIADSFDCEISFRFVIDGLTVTHRYVDIFKRRGADKGVKLRQGVEVNSIVIKKSIAEIATALKCKGSGINLEDYSYNDGEFYVSSGSLLCSRTAKRQWANFGDIVKTFTYETVDQATLCTQAIKRLTDLRNAEVTYETELNYLPDNLRIGDTVYLIDSDSDIYVTARVMKLETSEYDDKRTATLGEYS